MPQAPPRAEIVAFGNELISGARLDTNSQWLARRLGEIGIDVRFHTTAGDEVDECVASLREAARRSRLHAVPHLRRHDADLSRLRRPCARVQAGPALIPPGTVHAGRFTDAACSV